MVRWLPLRQVAFFAASRMLTDALLKSAIVPFNTKEKRAFQPHEINVVSHHVAVRGYADGEICSLSRVFPPASCDADLRACSTPRIAQVASRLSSLPQFARFCL